MVLLPHQLSGFFKTVHCSGCGLMENIGWVNGHGQCAHCHTNVMQCCDGARCEQSRKFFWDVKERQTGSAQLIGLSLRYHHKGL